MDWTIERIKEESPFYEDHGSQMAFYAVGCCWWTSFREDLAKHPSGLPCCPHCKSVLLQANLVPFLENAEAYPEHYGSHGLEAFLLAYHRNSDWCGRNWQRYETYLSGKKLAKRAVLTDLWGNEIERPSPSDRWNAVMEKLAALYDLHCRANRVGAEIDDLLTSVDELMAAYDAWLD